MLWTLAAALSLGASLTLDVPYLPQTDALCGGAAAAMVFRYWGDTHAGIEQFANLVDRRAGGIADTTLVSAVTARGWMAHRMTGSLDALRERVQARQPVIVLLADRRDTYHYVVVIGTAHDRIVLHDPAWGPSRSIADAEFVRLWKPTNFWSLVILPADARPSILRELQDRPERRRGATSSGRAEDALVSSLTLSPSKGERDRCDLLLDAAVADIQQRGLASAESRLNDIRVQCPASAGPLRELAGLRFAERRWADAADLARKALTIDPSDSYTWDVLASSLFMQDDPVGALRAWNRIGKPRVNLVKIEGLRRARYQIVADAIGLRPNALLTAEMFERAQRRLGELPDRVTARLELRPEADGFATVDVAVLERATTPRGAVEWTAAAVRSTVDREVAVAVPGRSGQGELWNASWRWWAERPRVAIGFAAPRVGRWAGVWRVDASWDAQTYLLGRDASAASIARESHAHGALTVSDWLTGSLRYSITAGADVWDRDRKAVMLGGALERRLFDDRIALSADGARWAPLAGGNGFNRAGVRAGFRSSAELTGWVWRAETGRERVSAAAPLGLWPGAGDGHARTPMLRAHPLVDGRIIDATESSAFGRALTYGSIEAQRWWQTPWLARMGIAGFADAARARTAHLDVGVGLRIKLPGTDGVLRVDAAHSLRDGANALTFGWQR